jgi:acetolactate synthase-1/2/3 large subunit
LCCQINGELILSTNTNTVASVIVSMLEDIGVDRAYSVSGESYLALLDELEARGHIDVVTCRHEGGAGLMAVADAKLSGKLGVCMVSRGPGAANSALAVVTAHEDTVPFLLLVGQVEKAHLRRDAFQELDYSKFFGGVAKWTAEINDPERAPDIMSRAIHMAFSGTPGPVVVSLPEDVLAQPVTAGVPAPYRPRRATASADQIEEAAELLRQASKPVIIAGGELANPAGREALLASAEKLNVPVLVSFRRLDLFPNAHALFAGELGFFNTPEQMQALEESDLILALGTRLGDLTTHGYAFPRSPQPDQALIHVHRDPRVIGRNYVPTLGIPGESELFLKALAERAAGYVGRNSEWIQRLRNMRTEISRWKRVEATDGVVFGNVVAALGRHIASDAIVALDAGISAALMYRYYEFKPPQILLTPITGSMGFGIPAAVSASLRYPERQVICLIGDGGILMGGNELAVAAERGLPITVLLANNNSYGAIRVNLEREYPGRTTATQLHNPDFSHLAAAYGCRFLKIEREDEVEDVLAAAFSERGLTLVEVQTSLEIALPKAVNAETA